MIVAQQNRREEGGVLVVATIAFTLVLAYVLATLATTSDKMRSASASTIELTSQYVAQAGLERGVHLLWTARNLASIATPFQGLEALDPSLIDGAGGFTQHFTAQPLVAADGTVIGEYDVAVDVGARLEAGHRDVTVVSIAYVPSKSAFAAGDTRASRAEARTVVRIAIGASPVFEYSYFANQWGWFFADNLVTNGNVRANGQFDFGGHTPGINGSPRYESSQGVDLIGYLDDNGDGLQDGNDGGVYAGLGVVGAGAITGMGGLPENQHAFQGQLPMPNISDLSRYESAAIAGGSSISVGATTLVSGVLGDDPTEPQNLYLEGTPAQPIVINGPVVVRGDVIIKGKVQGQGTIYAGRNVYVAGDMDYVNGPNTQRPADNAEATVEAWRQTNQSKDALALVAREHVVVGDYLSPTFQTSVGSWLSDPNNRSDEDAGADGIHNTALGLDGVPSADDDLLEDDGVWTVDHYTAADQLLGLIPAGFAVGDVVPGSGEDIDGDGVQDGQVTLAEFDISAPLDPVNWAGLDASYPSYSTVSTVNLHKIDASFYTNHFFAGLMVNYDAGHATYKDIKINGTVVCRNESILYAASNLILNHDERLTGVDSAGMFGLGMPVSWRAIEVLEWSSGGAGDISAYVAGVAP